MSPSITPPSSPTNNNHDNHNDPTIGVTGSADIIANVVNNIITNVVDISHVDSSDCEVIRGTDLSFNVPTISTYIVDETILQPSLVIRNKEGLTASGDFVAYTTFDTTDEIGIQVHQKLLEKLDVYTDDVSGNTNNLLVNQIKTYADEIQCSDFHGKGTIDDYAKLFQAASKIANESKSMQLNVDIEGFNEFAQAADELSNLFDSFIVKLQNINIINDTAFLQAIVNSLAKIVNLSNVFGNFKKTILATTTIQFPKSAHETSVILGGVMDEINCAMQYITNFVSPSENPPPGANISEEEQNVINQAVATIDNWNQICELGVSVAMENNVDVQFINQASNHLKQQTSALKNATTTLKNRLASFNIC